MSAHPGASFMWLMQHTRGVWEAQLPVLAIHIWDKKLRGLHGYACSDMHFSPPNWPVYKARWHGVLCSIRTWLWSCWQLGCTLLFVKLFTSKALSCCKYEMDALSWLNSDTLERAPSLFWTCKVLCLWVLFHKTKFTAYMQWRIKFSYCCSLFASIHIYWSRSTYYMYTVQLHEMLCLKINILHGVNREVICYQLEFRK